MNININMGALMENSLEHKTTNPVGQLRMIVSQMMNDLQWYRKKYPEADISKRSELIRKLDDICRTLESYGSLDVWNIIWEKLGEARDQKYNADTALVYFPLKQSLPNYHDSRQIVIDLCGYNLDPHEYDYCRGKFYASEVNE